MTMRYYRVTCYIPPREGKTYGHNMLLGVGAESVEDALRLTKKLYPQARIDSINDQGKIHTWETSSPCPDAAHARNVASVDLVALPEKPE